MNKVSALLKEMKATEIMSSPTRFLRCLLNITLQKLLLQEEQKGSKANWVKKAYRVVLWGKLYWQKSFLFVAGIVKQAS